MYQGFLSRLTFLRSFSYVSHLHWPARTRQNRSSLLPFFLFDRCHLITKWCMYYRHPLLRSMVDGIDHCDQGISMLQQSACLQKKHDVGKWIKVEIPVFTNDPFLWNPLPHTFPMLELGEMRPTVYCNFPKPTIRHPLPPQSFKLLSQAFCFSFFTPNLCYFACVWHYECLLRKQYCVSLSRTAEFSPCLWVWLFGTTVHTFGLRYGPTTKHTN